MPELKTIEQLAPELGIKPVTVRRLIHSGSLPYSRVGRRYVFTPAHIEAYLKHTEGNSKVLEALKNETPC
jgi:excisionase family DNA binding protein